MSIRNFHCSSCLIGKQTRKSISKVRSHESTEILELVHSDVAGPFRVQSLGGARYFVTFIEDFSRKTWVYFMTSKDQVFEKFKIFLHASERLSSKKLKILSSDNGGEYVSKLFLSYCSNAGITKQYSQPYTPQHNGIAERRNRSLLDIVRSILSNSLLPNHLWAEAVHAACVILNLRSSKAHPDKTPDKIFSGTKPSVSHLRTFGSLVYVHQSQSDRSKLDPRSTPHILLSFDDHIKGYCCYDPARRRILVSKDVTIIEDSAHLPSPP